MTPGPWNVPPGAVPVTLQREPPGPPAGPPPPQVGVHRGPPGPPPGAPYATGGGPPGPLPALAHGDHEQWHRWWDTARVPSTPQVQNPADAYEPPAHKLTTLGWLRHLKDPTWPYWEHYYFQFLHNNLTTNWANLMYGVDIQAMQLWWEVFQVLELDKKSQLDLLMLAQSGPVGRSYANKILWDIMANWALQRTYRDLSNKVSNEVNWARKNMDRPPKGHQDLQWWTWRSYQHPVPRQSPWSPCTLPPNTWDLRMGAGGEPLPPPHCWGTPHQ